MILVFSLIIVVTEVFAATGCTWVFAGPKDSNSCRSKCDGAGEAPITLPSQPGDTLAPTDRTNTKITLGTKPPTDSNGVPITLPPIVETDVDGRTVTDANGKPKTMTVTSPPQPTDDTSSNPSNGEEPIRTDPAVPGSGGNSNLGLIIGCAVGGVVFCCVVIAIIAFVVSRNKKKSSSSNDSRSGTMNFGSESTELKPRSPVYGETPKSPGDGSGTLQSFSTSGTQQPLLMQAHSVNVGIYGASPLAMQAQSFPSASTGSYSGYPNPGNQSPQQQQPNSNGNSVNSSEGNPNWYGNLEQVPSATSYQAMDVRPAEAKDNTIYQPGAADPRLRMPAALPPTQNY